MVSKARLDLPLPLGPVTTVSFPNGRTRSKPLRLFWRAPRISTQPCCEGGMMPEFFPLVEATDDNRCDWPKAQTIMFKRTGSDANARRGTTSPDYSGLT